MSTTTKKVYFENLDGLRFLCFLSVFLFHSFHTEFDYIKSSELYYFIKKDIFGNGNLGVNFFFVLSGFLITYLLIQEKTQSGQIHVRNFWIRRILRIWPLFYFCVFFGFYIFAKLKATFGQVPNETATLGYYLTFLNNFDMMKNGLPDASILGVLWSVAIEEQFYFIWPIILYFTPVRKYWVVFVVVIVGSLTIRSYDSPDYNELHTLSCIGDMAVGAFGAWFITQKDGFLSKITNLNKLSIILIYVLFTTLFFFKDELLDGFYITRVFDRLIISSVMLMIILEQTYAKNSFFKMSQFKTITHLGKISYGLYCLHFIGILTTTTLTKLLGINTKFWQVFILETTVALIITIVISYISYNFYEKPFLKLKEKFNS